MPDEIIETVPAPRASDQPQPVAHRWEWRTFGRNFGTAEDRLATLAASEPKESDEIYFLSDGGENVKVRDELMDVKILREVNPEGFERWEPVMKASFPLSAADAAKVAEALGLPLPSPQRDAYRLDEIIEACSRPGSKVRVVNVHKRRVRYTVEGCMAELSGITTNGLPVRTLAVESENSAAVLRAVEWLGLTDYANTSYPRALGGLLDGAPERFAVIDVGTNSVKFHIGALEADGSWTAVADRAVVTQLGANLEGGRISEAAVERTVDAIGGMVAEAKANGVRATAAVGTAVFRIAANAGEVLAAIRERNGVRIEVLSGEEEARLAYLATIVALGSTAGTTVVFDTGGGSSQFTFGHAGAIDERFSVNVGAARYTDRFGLAGSVSENTLREAMAAIADDLSCLDGRPVPDVLVGMGGALTNIAAVALALAEYDPARVQGAALTSDEIDEQIEDYRSQDADARRKIVGLQPKRAEVILAGACIVRTVIRKLGKDALIVSDKGVRHGVLAERFGI